ncbi:MAG TPA: elongation factor G, partial [Thermodesulfovibrionia bacterium]|nr:elongation factor G [Thermodesulfovibrionia bacterium]
HGGAGKTTLVEAILYDTNQTTRLGRVEDGNTTTDFEPEEIARNFSISSALAMTEWKGIRIYMVDTPGYTNFVEEARLCMSAVDSAIFLVSAVSGVKAETNKVWEFAEDFKVPRLVFINEMDKDLAEFEKAVGSLKETYGVTPLVLQIPIGAGAGFEGVIDLVRMKALYFKDKNMSESSVPDQYKEQAEAQRQKFIESLVETDDALLEKYFEEGEISKQEMEEALKRGTRNSKFVPVVCGSASKNMGIQSLLDAALLCLPGCAEMAEVKPIKGKETKAGKEITRKPLESEPLSAIVFKSIADPFAGRLSVFRVYSGVLKADSTILNASKDEKERVGQVFYLQGKDHVSAQQVGPGEIAAVAKLKDTTTGDTLCAENAAIVFDRVKLAEPMISFAIAPKSRGDEEKVSIGLTKMLEEDPSLQFHRDEETKDMLLAGMGQLHLEVTLDRLKRKFGVEVIMKAPTIPYRETIKAAAKGQGKYKKQSGGRGQYGDCWLDMEPLPPGSGFEFVDKIVGGSIPRQYIPAVEKGLVEAIKEGVVAGYPVVDLKISVFDGSYHAVDSSEMAFKIAASMGFKKIMQQARPVLLEPVMKMEIIIPEEFLGSVIGDLNSRRGKVQSMDSKRNSQVIRALVPMAEVLTYANQLNALTSAQGTYTMEFSHYEEMPAHLSKKVVEERTAAKEGQ